MTTTLLWFRRDLRLADNPALEAARADADRVVGVFCLDPALLQPAGDRRVAVLFRTLAALDAAMDGNLVVRTGSPVDVIPDLAREVGAAAVHAAEDFGPLGATRDDAVATALAEDDVAWVTTGSPYAVEPGTIMSKAGTPYKVFTPFSRVWRAHGWPAPVDQPGAVPWASAPGDGVPAPPAVSIELPACGEDAAHGRLERFLADRVDRYADTRDRPDLDATSRLSMDLKWGVLHPRQILARLGDGDGASVFATELCWRDFYADVLHHRPASARESMNERVGAMAWDHGPAADEHFDAWAAGRTGYPIVDAGMRQLLTEGWMHNRVRMIVASFLVKDLHLPWQRGARWFMQHLIDGDLASNQHGWQWTAGTGTDAAPFFRIFNPTAQGKRFDPDGAYIRRHVPELAAVDTASIHEPHRTDDGPGDYPRPIVDHAEERAESLARYEVR